VSTSWTISAPSAALDLADPLGDVLGIVADPFDHPGDLQCRDDLAQVVGHRCAQGQHPHGHGIDLHLQRIELLVARDYFSRQHLVTRDQRLHGIVDRQFREPAHLGNQAAQAGDVFVECLDRMFCHEDPLSRTGR
jgi:hypothetical protein